MDAIRAITLDLDNTLWNVFPAIERAEQNNHQFLAQRFPEIAECYSVDCIRQLRQWIFDDRPEIRHDFTELRRLVFVHMLNKFGHDTEIADEFVEHFLEFRNQVDLYPDVLPALERLHRKYPLVSLSDGNSNLEKIGIRDYFAGCIFAAEAGVLKPDAKGFLMACDIAGTSPAETLHIGDHPQYDIDGARNAGMKTMWICRDGTGFDSWDQQFEPDYRVKSLIEAVNILI